MMSARKQRMRFGEFVVDPAHNSISKGDDERRVPARVMDVLVHLVEHRERVVPAEELLDAFWPGRVVEESTLHRVISQIRNALGDDAREPRYIKTVSKRGYQAIAPVTADAALESPDDPPDDRSVGPAPAVPSVTPSRNWGYGVAAALLTFGLVAISLLWDDSEAPEPATATVEPTAVDAEPPSRPRMRDLPSIAVLPFANMSSDAESGHFADGLVDSVLDELARTNLKVAARTDAFDAANEGDVAKIAERLKVAYVLEGSVQRRGPDLRLTAQLIRAADGFHVWSKVYDRALEGGFGTQTEVAQNLAQLARSMLLSDIRRQHYDRFPDFQGVHPRAVNLYLDAQEQYNLVQMGEGGDWDYHIDLIKRAVAVDPDFARAHFDLAWAYMRRLGGSLDIETASREAHAAIERALELEPNSTLGLLQLAQIYLQLDLDYRSAEATIRRGLEKAPRSLWWHANLASIALREGREADARRWMATAAILDYQEEQTLFLIWHALKLLAIGDLEKALQATNQGLNLADSGPQRSTLLTLGARAYVELGNVDAAKSAMEEAWRIDGQANPERFITLYAATGNEARARELLSTARERPDTAHHLARGHLALGNIDDAFRQLEAGIEEHAEMVVSTLRLGRQWDSLREDPRFDTLIELLASKETRTDDAGRAP
jgi:TolB-like protein/DNA-binding winged helix-turn-helix (wHTH) protein